MIRGRKERREGGKRGRKEGRKGWGGVGGASQEGMTGSQHARDIFWLAK